MKVNGLGLNGAVVLVVLASAGTRVAAAATCKEGLAVKVVRGHLVVTGEVKGGTCYLGCTITDEDGDEHHLPPKTASGKFRLSFSGWHASQEWDWVVALWGKKVYKRNCENGPGGGPCKWCKKNGYHLEDRLDRVSGQYKPPKTLVNLIRWIRGVLGREVSRTRSTYSASAREIRSSEKDEATRKKLAESIRASLGRITDKLEETGAKTKAILKDQFETSEEERKEIVSNVNNIAWLVRQIGTATAKAYVAAGQGPEAWLEFADWLEDQDVELPYP